jgi:hypothetical protein
MPFAGRLLAFGRRSKSSVVKGMFGHVRRRLNVPTSGAKMLDQASSWADTNTLWFIIDR